mgnify:FL=1
MKNKGYVFAPYIISTCVQIIDIDVNDNYLSRWCRLIAESKREEKLNKLLYPLLYSDSSESESSSCSNSIKYIDISSNTNSI